VKRAIRTLLVDDHTIVREGLRALLEMSPGAGDRTIEVVGEAADGPTALTRCEELRPEVIVLDLSLPKLSGMEVAKALRKSASPPAIVVLSMHISTEHVRQAQEQGISAYVVKGTGVSDLASAIRRAVRGEKTFPEIRAEGAPTLTDRERQVLIEIAQGASNRQVAERLGISVHTVNTHRVHLMEKLKAHDVATLTRLAVTLGLVS
jgi:DNA-binding NarL/FixJ family response regulator